MARVGGFALTVVLGLLLAANGRADEPDRAEELFRAGNRAFATGDYPTAFTQYREAWSLRKSFDIACNLGRTEVELGFSRDAAEHLDECLRTFSVSSREDVKDAKARFRELFNRVRARVGALDVEARPSGAEIAVDGIAFGSAPLGKQLFVEPGERRVRARLVGYQEREVVVKVLAGGSAPVRLELEASTGAPLAAAVVPLSPLATSEPASSDHAKSPGTQSASPEKAPAGGVEPRTIVVISGAAVTLVGLGIGLGFMLHANSTGDRAEELGASLKDSHTSCASPAVSPDCEQLHSLVSEEEQSRNVADAAFLGGAIAAAATTLAWVLIPDFKSHPATGLQVWPRVSGARDVGLAVSGRY